MKRVKEIKEIALAAKQEFSKKNPAQAEINRFITALEKTEDYKGRLETARKVWDALQAGETEVDLFGTTIKMEDRMIDGKRVAANFGGEVVIYAGLNGNGTLEEIHRRTHEMRIPLENVKHAIWGINETHNRYPKMDAPNVALLARTENLQHYFGQHIYENDPYAEILTWNQPSLENALSDLENDGLTI